MADADADDLYSDLYGDEIQLTNSPPPEDNKSGIKQEERESSSSASNNAAVSSFIPGGAAYQPPTQTNNNQSSNSRFTNQSYNRSSGNQPQSSSSSSFIPNQSSSSSSSSSSFIPNSNSSNNDYSDSNNRNQRERRQYGSNAPNALFNQGNKFGFSNSGSSVGGANDARDRAPHQREQKEIPNESIGKLRPHEMPDDGKIFVGGLDWSTTDESLKGYFEHFGKVSHVTIMRDPSGKSRGFAFLCFADKNNVQEVMAREHVLDGKVIDAKRAIPRPEHQKCSKIFVGGVASTVTPDQFREFFTQYGTVTDSTLMMDKETQRTRGFGFVSFAEEDAAEKLIAIQPLEFEGKSMEIKPAAPKHERDQAPAGSTILRRGGGSGGTTSGQTYDSRTGDGQDHRLPKGQSNNNNQNNFNGMNMMGGGMGMNMGMNPMGMMSGDGGNQFDPSMMARMFQQTGWGSQQWNPQMLWQMNNGMMNGMNGMGGMGMNMGMMGGGGYGNNMNMNMGNFGGASSPMGMMGGIGMQSPMNHQMNNQIGGSMSPPPQNQMQQQRQSNQNSSSSSQQQQQVNPNGRKRVDYSNLDNYQIKTNDNNNGSNNNNNNNYQNNRSGGMSTLPKAPSTLPPRPNTFIQDRSQSTSSQSDTVIDVMSRGRNSSSRSKSPETAKRLAGRDRERSPDSKRRNGNGDEEGGGGGRADRY